MASFRSPRTLADRPRLRIRGPADLILAVPYLLGFHPQESLAIVGLAGGKVVVTARVDLADLMCSEQIDEEVLAGSLAAMIEGGSDNIVGLVFDDRACPDGARRPGPLRWQALAGALDHHVRRWGAHTDDVLLVSGGRWWSYHCADPDCCPPEGTPLADAGSVVPASAAYAGLVALPDRGALAEQLAPLPAAERDELSGSLLAAETLLQAAAPIGRGARGRSGVLKIDDPISVRRALFTTARRVSFPPELSREHLVGFGAALRVIGVRDEMWLAVDARRIDGRELWRVLGRQLPDPYAAAPLFLFGWASWRAGAGALANIAADAALASDPSYTAADLLLAVLSRGTDPRSMPPLRSSPA